MVFCTQSLILCLITTQYRSPLESLSNELISIVLRNIIIRFTASRALVLSRSKHFPPYNSQLSKNWLKNLIFLFSTAFERLHYGPIENRFIFNNSKRDENIMIEILFTFRRGVRKYLNIVEVEFFFITVLLRLLLRPINKTIFLWFYTWFSTRISTYSLNSKSYWYFVLRMMMLCKD